ncbi:hypothetical protein A3A67_00555 [Candidatus Peribacteria bacterium RIFCSPLOWO2_01_FULL_51_18]|nr:MAG: hypothetical protein A3C52_04990 [Candidatus Peribacteria bacterium RIFCSPHIGHO2_02_FULL_51_15]OGJ64953.1 MAG: hypothetical protein A3A67_00555 [Candidatus Peribacteria bacterium RIFCSPLOWO2_01_FULL_51_18]OGJ69501.1 MAG: hypothetical protein A3J34_02620 [Candidatus Peribacteria bacterium RIFCSPLOWO2_02_FULL_51_10]
MSHFVIVDGHHLMYRAYWAIPRTMRTSAGEQSNTAFGVASMLLQILKTEQPDSIMFCFDAGDETFRHKEYVEYKGGRAETPDDFYTQIPRTLEMIDAFGIRSVSGRKYEADDFACTYAKKAVGDGNRVTIISGDRDLMQLASDKIRIAIPHKAYQAAEYFGPSEVEKKFGVTPDQIPSYKGLVGDSSDNLKGVKGIGPVAATELLQEYQTLENLYQNLEKIKPVWRSKLEAGRQQAFFCQRMALLVCDIPETRPIEEFVFENIPAEPIFSIFNSLQFTLLIKRFESFLATSFGQAHFKSANPIGIKKTEEKSQKNESMEGQMTLL